MPLEIGWAFTVQWTAGDAMCRIMMFFRTFGLYLSSFILVCISVDRFVYLTFPFNRIFGERHLLSLLESTTMLLSHSSLPGNLKIAKKTRYLHTSSSSCEGSQNCLRGIWKKNNKTLHILFWQICKIFIYRWLGKLMHKSSIPASFFNT